MNAVIGALIEAWDELRIHKMRVLLSLLGVAVSVAALTAVSALITTTSQLDREMMERDMGRVGTVTVGVSAPENSDPLAWTTEVNSAFTDFLDKNQVTFASRVTTSFAEFDGGSYPVSSELVVVDKDYEIIHRLALARGSWFTSNADDRLAPAVVVNEAFLRELGKAGAPLPFTAEMRLGDGQVRSTVVVSGVVPDRWEFEGPRSFLLTEAYLGLLERSGLRGTGLEVGDTNLEMWVGLEQMQTAQRIASVTFESLSAGGVWVSYNEYEWIEESAKIMSYIGFSVSGLVLGLAALNLLNIALVTLRQRIREIGIRRAFGAGSGRIFFAVMMESVVATVLAGAIGVGLAAAIYMALPLDEMITGTALQDPIPFPRDAAALGLFSATAVGALTGLIPALVAVRIKPIDAIRF